MSKEHLQSFTQTGPEVKDPNLMTDFTETKQISIDDPPKIKDPEERAETIHELHATEVDNLDDEQKEIYEKVVELTQDFNELIVGDIKNPGGNSQEILDLMFQTNQHGVTQINTGAQLALLKPETDLIKRALTSRLQTIIPKLLLIADPKCRYIRDLQITQAIDTSMDHQLANIYLQLTPMPLDPTSELLLYLAEKTLNNDDDDSEVKTYLSPMISNYTKRINWDRIPEAMHPLIKQRMKTNTSSSLIPDNLQDYELSTYNFTPCYLYLIKDPFVLEFIEEMQIKELLSDKSSSKGLKNYDTANLAPFNEAKMRLGIPPIRIMIEHLNNLRLLYPGTVLTSQNTDSYILTPLGKLEVTLLNRLNSLPAMKKEDGSPIPGIEYFNQVKERLLEKSAHAAEQLRETKESKIKGTDIKSLISDQLDMLGVLDDSFEKWKKVQREEVQQILEERTESSPVEQPPDIRDATTFAPLSTHSFVAEQLRAQDIVPEGSLFLTNHKEFDLPNRLKDEPEHPAETIAIFQETQNHPQLTLKNLVPKIYQITVTDEIFTRRTILKPFYDADPEKRANLLTNQINLIKLIKGNPELEKIYYTATSHPEIDITQLQNWLERIQSQSDPEKELAKTPFREAITTLNTELIRRIACGNEIIDRISFTQGKIEVAKAVTNSQRYEPTIPIELTAKPEQAIILTGPTGSGKSTALKLLARSLNSTEVITRGQVKIPKQKTNQHGVKVAGMQRGHHTESISEWEFRARTGKHAREFNPYLLCTDEPEIGAPIEQAQAWVIASIIIDLDNGITPIISSHNVREILIALEILGYPARTLFINPVTRNPEPGVAGSFTENTLTQENVPRHIIETMEDVRSATRSNLTEVVDIEVPSEKEIEETSPQRFMTEDDLRDIQAQKLLQYMAMKMKNVSSDLNRRMNLTVPLETTLEQVNLEEKKRKKSIQQITEIEKLPVKTLSEITMVLEVTRHLTQQPNWEYINSLDPARILEAINSLEQNQEILFDSESTSRVHQIKLFLEKALKNIDTIENFNLKDLQSLQEDEPTETVQDILTDYPRSQTFLEELAQKVDQDTDMDLDYQLELLHHLQEEAQETTQAMNEGINQALLKLIIAYYVNNPEYSDWTETIEIGEPGLQITDLYNIGIDVMDFEVPGLIDLETPGHNTTQAKKHPVVAINGLNMGGKTKTCEGIGIGWLIYRLRGKFPAKKVKLPFMPQRVVLATSFHRDKKRSTFENEACRINRVMQGIGPDTLIIADELTTGTNVTDQEGLMLGIGKTAYERGSLLLLTTHLTGLPRSMSTLKQESKFPITPIGFTRIEDKDSTHYARTKPGQWEDAQTLEVALEITGDTKTYKLALIIRDMLKELHKKETDFLSL